MRKHVRFTHRSIQRATSKECVYTAPVEDQAEVGETLKAKCKKERDIGEGIKNAKALSGFEVQVKSPNAKTGFTVGCQKFHLKEYGM